MFAAYVPTLRRCSPCVIVCDITVIVLCNTRLKCQLSDVLHDSRSLLKCFVLLIQTPYQLHMHYTCPSIFCNNRISKLHILQSHSLAYYIWTDYMGKCIAKIERAKKSYRSYNSLKMQRPFFPTI